MTDLDSAVDRLHAVPLEDFVAERKRLAKELRAAGDRESAAELAKLPKPSAPAWALNQLAREQPHVVAGWLDAAEALRDASSSAGRGSGDALRAAMAAHREATRGLLARVREEARPNGRELSEPMLDRVRELLQAATADPERAELLRAGRASEGGEDDGRRRCRSRPRAAARRRRPARRRRAAAPRAAARAAATRRPAPPAPARRPRLKGPRRRGARRARGGGARRARAARRRRRGARRRAARGRRGARRRRGDRRRAARGGAPHAAPLGVGGGRRARGRRGGGGGSRAGRARAPDAEREAVLVGCRA